MTWISIGACRGLYSVNTYNFLFINPYLNFDKEEELLKALEHKVRRVVRSLGWLFAAGAFLFVIYFFSISPATSTSVASKDVLNTVRLSKSNGFSFPKVVPDPNPLQILGPAGEIFTFVKTGATTCGSYVMAEAVIPPGAGPLPHIHHFTDEWFYFPDGGIVLEHSSQQFPDLKKIPGENAPKETLHFIKTKPGDLYHGPRYYIHGFFNESDSPKRLIFIWTPDDAKVGITAYFKAVGQQIKDIKRIPEISPLSKLLFVSEAPQFGINQSHDFWQYVSDIDFDFPQMDVHQEQLQKLLAPDLVGAPKRRCSVVKS